MSDTKRPHVIPIVHLARFASNPNAPKNAKRIHTFSKRQNGFLYDLREVDKTSRRIKRVAYIPEFYERYGQGDEQEARFGFLESAAARVIEDLVNQKTDEKVNSKQRERLSEFLAVLHYRTLKQRLFIERENRVVQRAVINNPDSESARDYFDSIYNTMKSRHDVEMLLLDRDYTEAQKHSEPQRSIALEKINVEREESTKKWEQFKEFEEDFKRAMANKETRERFIELSNDTRSRHLDVINLASQRLTQIIDHARWKVELNRSIMTMPFVTTDSPLVVYPLAEPANDEPLARMNFELCKLGIVDFIDNQNNYPPYVLYRPLNPQLILSIAPTLQREVVFDHMEILDFQCLQYIQAHDEIYSHEDTKFMLVEKVFAIEKEIRAALGLQFRQDWT